jgi:hypothetical protein
MSVVVGSLLVRQANGLAAFSLHVDRSSCHRKCVEIATCVRRSMREVNQPPVGFSARTCQPVALETHNPSNRGQLGAFSASSYRVALRVR